MADLFFNCLTRFPEPSVHLRVLLQNKSLAQLADKDFWFHSYSDRPHYGYKGDDFLYGDSKIQIRHFTPRSCSISQARLDSKKDLYFKNTSIYNNSLDVPNTGTLQEEKERLKTWRETFKLPDHKQTLKTLIEPYINEGKTPYLIGAIHWDRRCEGPPGHVHGGAVFTSMDLVLGQLVAYYNAAPYVTYRLNLDYRKVVPLNTTLFYKVWIEKHEGPKAFVKGYTFDPFRETGSNKIPDVANMDFGKEDIESKYYHHTINGIFHKLDTSKLDLKHSSLKSNL